MLDAFKDIIGTKFNRLTVTSDFKKSGWTKMFKCVCECGGETYITAHDIRKGKRISCGCYRSEGGDHIYNYTGYKEITGSKWNSFLQNAACRNIEWNVTKEQLWNLFEQQKGKCALSGMDISFKDKTASPDRINSKLHYTLDNVQLLHKDVNLMKNHFNQQYFIETCNRITNLSS